MASTPTTIPVTVQVDFDAMLRQGLPEGYDHENDEVILGGPLYAALVAQAATIIAESARKSVAAAAAAAVQQTVEREVAAIVSKTLEEGAVISDGYRQKQVKPMRELIKSEVDAWLTKSPRDPYDRKGSPLAELIKKEVDSALATQMREEIAAAKESVREAVKKAAADQIAKAVVR
jgi:hypothetical protein